jgi:hypothetical protein
MGLQAKSMLLVGRGYDADWIRALVNQQGEWANIPPKLNRKDPIYLPWRSFRHDREEHGT